MRSLKDFLDFVNASPSPYHAVANAVSLLTKVGYTELREKDQWNVQPGGRHFVVRNGSSIVAFAAGGKWRPGNGVAIVGAHTDSPCLRIKPHSARSTNGYFQVGVETYGGGLWPTWFDRDLGIAGKVYVSARGKHETRLVRINKPILRIPTLAIHLGREAGTKFEFNKEDQLFPILGLVGQQLGVEVSEKAANEMSKPNVGVQPMILRHNSGLLSAVAKELACSPEDIEDFELVLYDTQDAVVGGLNDEFVFGPRQDNLNSSFCSLQGLIEASNLETDSVIRAVALFDHEEVGSMTAQGAASNFLEAVISRLAAQGNSSGIYESLAKSFLLSADMAHAVHPNYSSKHNAEHRPAINSGPVIKINANQRYATNSVGTVLLNKVAELADVPLQLFVVRNDSPCGSTIGPIMASRLGIRTLDLGNAQLSMHSIRETAGSKDVEYAVALYKAFFEHYTETEATID